MSTLWPENQSARTIAAVDIPVLKIPYFCSKKSVGGENGTNVAVGRCKGTVIPETESLFHFKKIWLQATSETPGQKEVGVDFLTIFRFAYSTINLNNPV